MVVSNSSSSPSQTKTKVPDAVKDTLTEKARVVIDNIIKPNLSPLLPLKTTLTTLLMSTVNGTETISISVPHTTALTLARLHLHLI